VPDRPLRAAALRYDGSGAPRVVAAGSGEIARRILELGQEHGVAMREDAALADALARLQLEAEVPEDLWQAVAEVLVWAHGLDRSWRTAHGG
jgi:flagellar biosynthesis protein